MWSVYVQLSVFFVLGIYLGERVSAGSAVIFILSVIITAGFRKIVIKKFFPAHTIVILAAAAGILAYHYSISESVRPAYELNDKYVTMLGKITDLPKSEGENNIYMVDVKLMNYLGKNHRFRERVRVTSAEKFQFGDSVRIEGFLETFAEKLNRGDFDTAKNYKAKGVYFKIYAEEMSLCHTQFKSYSPAYFFTWIKSMISDRIYEVYSGDEAAIMKAVLTGYKDAFSEDFETDLYESNTMRMFYPAFIHISFILMLVGMLSSFVKKEKRDIILIVLLISYAIANMNYHYILKTAAVLCVVIYSRHKFGFSNYMDILSLVAGIILIFNPLTAFETGFILSIAANIVIYYFMPVALKCLSGIKNREFRSFLSLGIVISVGLLPLQAYFFNFTTPYAFLLNLAYIPLLSILWISAPLNLLLGALMGYFNIFGYIADGVLFFMKMIPKIVQKLPWYTVPLPRPGILVIAVFYMGMYILRKYVLKKGGKLSVQAVCALTAGFCISLGVSFVQDINKLNISFVNVGQGDGAVLSVPFRETILIDGGGSSEFSNYDYGKEIFVPYLKREGYRDIELAVVSHYHSDHCKGIIDAMKRLKVREVLMPDCMEDNKYRKEIEQIAEKKNIKLSYFKAGIKLKYKSGLELEIIAPDESDILSEEENDTSIAMRVSYGDFKVLFTGDMTKDVENNHLGEWEDCDVIKVPHHGSKTSSGEEFLNEVLPETAVISVGAGNSYGLPADEIVERYERLGTHVYRTDLYGDIKIYATKKGAYIIESFLDGEEEGVKKSL